MALLAKGCKGPGGPFLKYCFLCKNEQIEPNIMGVKGGVFLSITLSVSIILGVFASFESEKKILIRVKIIHAFRKLLKEKNSL